MAYTVKQLAKISGVSVRTLHWYDEVGLLKPAYQGANGYRYYEEKQCLRLQQILFFRELGFPLNDIQKLLAQDDFDHIKALNAHKRVLEKEINRRKELLETIDKTINHLRGKHKMSNQELYYGFDSKKQKEHEQYLIDNGIVTQEFMDECNKKVKNWSDVEKNAFIHEGEQIMKDLCLCIDHKLEYNNPRVQELMQKHYNWLLLSWTPTKESYLGLADLYHTPEFRAFFDNRHPKLLSFITDAMKLFAEQSLS